MHAQPPVDACALHADKDAGVDGRPRGAAAAASAAICAHAVLRPPQNLLEPCQVALVLLQRHALHLAGVAAHRRLRRPVPIGLGRRLAVVLQAVIAVAAEPAKPCPVIASTRGRAVRVGVVRGAASHHVIPGVALVLLALLLGGLALRIQQSGAGQQRTDGGGPMSDIDTLVVALLVNVRELLQLFQLGHQLPVGQRHPRVAASLHDKLQHCKRLIHIPPLVSGVA
mmetsp:Transcript_12794/g.32276  ORF Transcript_12794/g.32276 Transcript_12794/m.32276 type:complete len:226 (+) Transcript_12794:660-1337(+)